MLKSSFWRRIVTWCSSRSCFRLIVAFFIFEAAWIALSGRYPMAFDEDYHLGIIRIYAHHLNPFLAAQPADADQFGAVFRDPSYLYHYLMSFPYRLISLFTHSETIQVISLRFINISLFASSLPLYRRLLLKSGPSQGLVNVVLAFFVLIPVVPLLAAQINYDNLLLPLTALTLLVTVNLVMELRQRQSLNGHRLAQLLILGLLASLVKYAFLPIFLAIGGFVLVQLYIVSRGSVGKMGRKLAYSLVFLSRRARWGYGLALIISLILFGQRYGINLVRYHTPVPSCDQVLSVEACSQYGPWARDYHLARDKTTVNSNPIRYTQTWFYSMWQRLFFSLDGPRNHFQTRGPLPLPALSAIGLAGIGLVLFVVYSRRIFQEYDSTLFWLVITVSAVYVGILWLEGYQSFLQTGAPVAINGRYLFPILLPLMLLLALGYSQALRHHSRLKYTIAGLGLICFIWGGGWLTYVLRSNPAWYWPNSTVWAANHAVRTVLDPVVPGTSRPTQFLH